jgi:beta-xylosidase
MVVFSKNVIALYFISVLCWSNVAFGNIPDKLLPDGNIQADSSCLEWTNPIRNGLNDYGNKDFNVLYIEGKYFLTATEQNNPKENKRGVILYESKDMLNWTESAVLIDRNKVAPDKWYLDEWRAPKIVEYKGKYYLTFNCRNNTLRPYSKTGLGIAVSDAINGNYTLLTPDKSIVEANNSFVFVDTDNKVYVYWDMDGRIFASEIDLEGAVLLGETKEIFSPKTMGNNFHFSDSPFLMKKDDDYIMLITQFYGGYVIRVRQLVTKYPFGPWKFNDDGELLKFFESEADEALKMPYEQGYTFAPPTQVIFHHSIFKGKNEKYFMAWHTSEKYSEPYLWITPVTFSKNRVKLIDPKSKYQKVRVK